MDEQTAFNLKLEEVGRKKLERTMQIKERAREEEFARTMAEERAQRKPTTSSTIVRDRETVRKMPSGTLEMFMGTGAPMDADPNAKELRAAMAEDKTKFAYVGLNATRDKEVYQMFDMINEKQNDSSMNRQHKMKDTFTSVFPGYGLYEGKQMFKSANTHLVAKFDEGETCDKTFHNKTDFIKRYTEEMLKASDMRMKKK